MANKNLHTYLLNNVNGINAQVLTFCTMFWIKNSKRRFLWHRNNRKIHHILQP